MPPKPRPVDADQLVKDYVGGLGAKALTKKHRTEWRRRKNILAERGVPLRTMSDSVKAGFSRMSKRAARAQDAGRRKTKQKTLAKIDASAARRIVARYRRGDAIVVLAEAHGVCRRTIARLLNASS